jgi:hypothetical protein
MSVPIAVEARRAGSRHIASTNCKHAFIPVPSYNDERGVITISPFIL